MTRTRRAQTISLSGDGWHFREALGDSWRWLADGAQPETGNNVTDAADALSAPIGWFPARTPSAVIDELVRVGEVPDPRHERDSRLVEWVADRYWVFRRVLDLPQLDPADAVTIEIDGVDPGAAVFWDGIHLGSWSGLYRAVRYDLRERAGDSLGQGQHTLTVVVPPAVDSVPQVGRTDEVAVHAPRVGHGWDFCPRFRHQGIWRSIRLTVGRAQLHAVTARADLTSDSQSGKVVVNAECTLDAGTATLEVLDGDAVVATSTQAIEADGVVTAMVDLDAPELWWPSGFGAQKLYRARLTVSDDISIVHHEFDIAFRTAFLETNPDSPAGALGYTARVNGVVVPLIGWNWAPADAQFGSITPERTRHLVALARDSGARVLRVWGGGLIETDEFYRACDELGILVWQEFSQSSSGLQSAPSADPAFVAHLAAEAAHIVPTLTHHPSLLLWGGGNELTSPGEIPLTDAESPALTALHDAVERLDPGRSWLPTSPTGPVFHNRLDRIRDDPDSQHDVHGPWEHQGLAAHAELYNAGTSLAHTEFGVEGMTNLRSLYALIDAEHRWPTGRENPVYRHLGDWWNNAPLVAESFGDAVHNVEAMQQCSQLLQAHALQYAVEASRRRHPRNSMIIPWQLAESFPNAWCTSVVDYHGEPKAAYYAVSRAYEPRRATLRVDTFAWAGVETVRAEAWVWAEPHVGEGAVGAGSSLTIRARRLNGDVMAEIVLSHLAEVTTPMTVGTLEFRNPGGNEMFVWEAEWRDADSRIIDQERQLASTGSDWSGLNGGNSTYSTQVVALADDAFEVTVTHQSGPAIAALRILDDRPTTAAGWLVATGDPRPLMPGETRTFHCTWTGATQRAFRVSGWDQSLFSTGSGNLNDGRV